MDRKGGREGASGDDPGFALPLRVSSPSITTSDTIRIASLLSQGRGGRDGVSYNYKSQRRRERERERELHSSLSDVPHCPPQRLFPPLLRIIPSFRPRYFLAQPSNNGRGWEEDLGEKLWFVFFFFVVFFFFLCVIVIVNFWFFAMFWSYDFHETSSEVLER